MQELTEDGRETVAALARRHGVSEAAVTELLRALAAGGGSMAQFSIPELGGMGQWSRGGMVMVGDMFNSALKARVDALCRDLAGLLGAKPLLAHEANPAQGRTEAGMSAPQPANWWPLELGAPSTSGAQNDMRYAWFPASRRLAIQQGGRMRLYDTGEHRIGGVSQQQGGGQSLSFTSQHGPVRLADLPEVAAGSARPSAAEPPQAVESRGDELAQIERLAELHQRGVLNAEEFAAKKAELLGRV